MNKLFTINGVESYETKDLCVIRIPINGRFKELYKIIAEFVAQNGEYLGVRRVKECL